MGPLIRKHGLTQPAVAWLFSGTANEFGVHLLKPPIELLSRWERGTNLLSNALVELSQATGIVYVSEYLPAGTILWEGSLLNLGAPPYTFAGGLVKVIESRAIPDVKGRDIRYSAVVTEFNDVLPDILPGT